MTAERLSAITWDAWNRRAWLAAYADARRIARVRERRAREVRTYDAARYSVRADRFSSVDLGRWYADERRARKGW